MKILMKSIVMLVICMAVLHAFALDASAKTSVDRYYEEKVEYLQKTVVVSVQDDTEEENAPSDFVTSFPTIEMEPSKENIRPSADLANQERKEYVSIPLYFQNDYPESLYGSGTVETSGCSITSLAMGATYLTGYEKLPDELAYYFGGRAESNIARMELAAETLGLPYEKPENWHFTLAELKKGKCAIVLVDGNSDFTSTQHFIVLTGVSQLEGESVPIDPVTGKEEPIRVYVNDSYAPNYSAWDLLEGYENGFEESDIIKGYQGSWVFDKSVMPEEIERYFEPVPEPADDRYDSIDLSFAERQLLARVVWVEARGESPEGQQAVAEVVLNRLLSEKFPDDVRDIVFQENQFRSLPFLGDAEPGQAQYQAIEKALFGPYVLDTDVFYFASEKTNNNVWGTIGNHIFCREE